MRLNVQSIRSKAVAVIQYSLESPREKKSFKRSIIPFTFRFYAHLHFSERESLQITLLVPRCSHSLCLWSFTMASFYSLFIRCLPLFAVVRQLLRLSFSPSPAHPEIATSDVRTMREKTCLLRREEKTETKKGKKLK